MTTTIQAPTETTTLADVQAALDAIGPRPTPEHGPAWTAHQNAWTRYYNTRAAWQSEHPRVFNVTIASPTLDPWRFQVTAPNHNAALSEANWRAAERQDPDLRIHAAPALIACTDCDGSGRDKRPCGCQHGCSRCDYTGRSVFACPACDGTGEVTQSAIPSHWPA